MERPVQFIIIGGLNICKQKRSKKKKSIQPLARWSWERQAGQWLKMIFWFMMRWNIKIRRKPHIENMTSRYFPLSRNRKVKTKLIVHSSSNLCQSSPLKSQIYSQSLEVPTKSKSTHFTPPTKRYNFARRKWNRNRTRDVPPANQRWRECRRSATSQSITPRLETCTPLRSS